MRIGDKVKTLTIETIDPIIDRFKSDPWLYDNNVWICYEVCKREIRRLEIERKIEWDEYDLYIKHITERLGI